MYQGPPGSTTLYAMRGLFFVQLHWLHTSKPGPDLFALIL